MSAYSFATSSPPERPEPREVLHSSDGNVSVWNYDTGLGLDAPDWITTVRWVDALGAHDAIFDSDTGRLGWVEAIGVFETTRGPVYLLVSEDVRLENAHATILTAFRAADGVLHEASGFFPPDLPGANESRSSVAWEYLRVRGREGRRPVEVRIDESAIERLDVSVAIGRAEASFALELRGSALVSVGLRARVLEPFVS